MPRTFDPISAIEAAYDLDSPEPAWLEGLAKALAPVLDHDYGVVAGTYLLDGEHTRYGHRIGVGVPDALFQAGEADPSIGRLLESLFTTPGSFHNLSEVVPQLTEQLRQHAPQAWDVVGMLARRNPREGLFVSAMTTGPYSVTRRQRRLFDHLAAHAEAAHRLRATLATEAEPSQDAVFTEAGRCVHAEGAARGRSLQDRLRIAVKNMDRARGGLRSERPSEAVEMWPAMVSGQWSLLDRFESDGRRFVVAVRNPVSEEQPRALTDRERATLHHAMLGRTNDEIAYALGVGSSTARTHLARALRKLGIGSRAELLALGALAAG